ncbi:hypothetical protein [Microbacterium gorillae]|uniref:hypothetical protein n=1 Tax=Microbacterium gorillae TaxID=1231063 RepID=UPI003D968F5F
MSMIDSRGNIHGSTGRFAGRVNSKPRDHLDPASYPVDGDADDVTGLRESFAEQLKTDADLQRAIEAMERQGIDFRVYNPNAEQIAAMVKDAIVAERWRDTPAAGAVNQFAIRDVTVMGGDEIRAMTPRQRRHLLSQAVQAASRLQDYMHELDELPAEDTSHLEVVDFRHVTEKNVTDVWFAARDQLGARGVLRTRSDFDAAIGDREDERGNPVVVTEAHADRAWSYYLEEKAEGYESAIADQREYDLFQRLAEDAVRETH